MYPVVVLLFFFFNDTATTEIYTLSLHDALPICLRGVRRAVGLHRSLRALRALRDLDLPGLGDRLQGQGPARTALGDRYSVDGGLLPDGQRGHDDGDLPDRRHPAPADELRRDHHRDLHGGPGALAECETTSVDTVLLKLLKPFDGMGV